MRKYMAKLNIWTGQLLAYVEDEVELDEDGSPKTDPQFYLLKSGPVRKKDVKAKEFYWVDDDEAEEKTLLGV